MQLKHVALQEPRHEASVFLQLSLHWELPPHAFWQDWLVVPQGPAQDVAVDRQPVAALHVPSAAASLAASAEAASPTGS
ncbi:MAG TPA: hypothetical protein VF316_25420 [Polyangiaceae bacterium]